MKTEKANGQIRRSQRVSIRIPVEVIYKGSEGKFVVEETHTSTVNAHGAGLVLKNATLLGQTVLVIHALTRQEVTARVVFSSPAKGSADHDIGVEFEQPSPSFWHITFPPDDWAPFSQGLSFAAINEILKNGG